MFSETKVKKKRHVLVLMQSRLEMQIFFLKLDNKTTQRAKVSGL